MTNARSILPIGALAAILAGCVNTEQRVAATGERYPWKKNIVTTVFWIGERPSRNNPVPNRASSWDKEWGGISGGLTVRNQPIASIIFRERSRLDRTRFIGPSPSTKRHPRVTGPRPPARYPSSTEH